MKKYKYLGGFPPPYGGVTIKNKLLYSKLNEHISIEQSNFYNHDKSLLIRISALFNDLVINKKNGLIIGLSKDSLKKVTYILYILNKRLMNNSVVMVMGGTFPEMVKKDKKLKIYLKEYKHIYVETEGMKKSLNSCGVNNVSVFPNCRERTDIDIREKYNNKQIRCLFFSLISEDKGADIVVSAAEILTQKGINYSIDFYGHIDSKYEQNFHDKIKNNEKLNYCGVFKAASKDDVYKKMLEYDVLLFPTKWKNEGVPGVLVESKIAGIPAVVSDINYNSEIVENKKAGIVLKENTPKELAKAIELLYLDENLLLKLKRGAKDSSKNYLIENYIEQIIEIIES